MAQLKFRFIVYLLLDVLLLALAVCNLPTVFERAKVPFVVDHQGDQLVVEQIIHPESCSALKEKDRILLWNQYEVKSIDAVEFLSDLSSIGEKITLRIERKEIMSETEITLVPFYESPRFVIVMIIVGFIIWCMAVFVAINRLDGPAAYSLHWALISLAVAILLTQGKISLSNVYLIVSRVGLLFSYLLAAGLFFFFTTIYPYNKLGAIKLKLGFIFFPIVATIAATVFFFIEAVESPVAIDSYLWSYEIYHIVLAIFAIGIIVSVIHSYIHAQSTENRSRLQWILWGFVVGEAPFLLFIIVPQILFTKDWIPEEYANVFLLAMPFSFALSFAKYRLFDVQVIINRSIVYTILSIFIGLTYVLIVVLGTSLISGEIVFTQYLTILLITLLIAWILNPLRQRLQRVVDETLFPARVNYRRTITHVADMLHKVLSVNELAQCIVKNSIEAVQLRSMAFYALEEKLLLMKYSHGGIVYNNIEIPSIFKGNEISEQPIALPSVLGSAEEEVDTSHSEWLKKIGFDLCIPMISESGVLHGMICASPRIENNRLTHEEIELLNTIAVQASEVLGRLVLQKQVILEQEERQKVEELNKLKTYFVSSVSHELQTPLTSIRMFAETLRQEKIHSKNKQRKYLEIIDQESERLSRLIDNVLDFSQVERGVKGYLFADIDVRQVVKKALSALRYQFEQSEIKLQVKIANSLPTIKADADALEEVFINLLSNAIKYSGSRKEVALRVQHTRKELVIQVTDKGVGIPQNELDRIFVPFHRVTETKQLKGMGLGLSLVKHIVGAHNGTIEVQSELGKGSTFTIHLPLNRDIRRKKE
jgi:signal transduction histidine kinase